MKAFGNGAYLTTIQDAVIKNVRIGAKNKSYTHLFCLKKGVKGKQKERGQVKGDTDAKQTRKWPDWRYGGSTNKRSNLGTVARSAGRCCVVFVFFSLLLNARTVVILSLCRGFFFMLLDVRRLRGYMD